MKNKVYPISLKYPDNNEGCLTAHVVTPLSWDYIPDLGRVIFRKLLSHDGIETSVKSSADVFIKEDLRRDTYGVLHKIFYIYAYEGELKIDLYIINSGLTKTELDLETFSSKTVDGKSVKDGVTHHICMTFPILEHSRFIEDEIITPVVASGVFLMRENESFSMKINICRINDELVFDIGELFVEQYIQRFGMLTKTIVQNKKDLIYNERILKEITVAQAGHEAFFLDSLEHFTLKEILIFNRKRKATATFDGDTLYLIGQEQILELSYSAF